MWDQEIHLHSGHSKKLLAGTSSQGNKGETTFNTPFGLCEFAVMPFGLHNTPVPFQHLMNCVLQGCQRFAQAYIDDVVLFSRIWEEHLQHLRAVLTALQQAGHTLKLPKCQFGLKEMKHLGHIIGGGQLCLDPEKLVAIQRYTQALRPAMISQVNSFIGLASLNTSLCLTLQQLLPLSLTFWRKNQQKRCSGPQDVKQLLKLKAILTTSPVLKLSSTRMPASECGCSVPWTSQSPNLRRRDESHSRARQPGPEPTELNSIPIVLIAYLKLYCIKSVGFQLFWCHTSVGFMKLCTLMCDNRS